MKIDFFLTDTYIVLLTGTQSRLCNQHRQVSGSCSTERGRLIHIHYGYIFTLIIVNTIQYVSPSELHCSILFQLQKAIEGSTRSGVRLRPPLASFRDTIREYSKPTRASSASTSPLSSSGPESYHVSSEVVPLDPLAPVQPQEETEVWIEEVKRSSTGSSSASDSPRAGSRFCKKGRPSGSPPKTSSFRPNLSLESLTPVPEDKSDEDKKSDEEEPL